MNITFDLDDKHHQQIELNSTDQNQHTHLINSHEVEIQLSNRKTSVTTTDDANQVYSQPIIDHNWESRYHAGHLVATCGHFVAYALKPQSGDDIVCVFYKQVDFRSVLNPPFSGDIHDLAFSFSDDILLACVDQASHLRIYRIEHIDDPNELQHTLILFIDLQIANSQVPPTLSWCCFIPDNNDNEENDPINDAYTMMTVTRGSQVELFNVTIASQSFISENMLTLNQIENGRLTYDDNNGNVTCVCFSPDGTALGTGTDKGEIKFFSINFNSPNNCRCLHLWIPHDNRPISCLFFLDDHKNLTQETQLWRYAISGCDRNSELKVWSCTNWNCLQVIRFQYSFIDSAFHLPSQLPILKASIDLTSRFLVLSDINRNCLYVLTIYQDADNNRARFSSINAFTTINSPSLSFAITAADRLLLNRPQEEEQQTNLLSSEHTDFVAYAVRMYSIHIKFFQELLLVFKTSNFMLPSSTNQQQSKSSFDSNPGSFDPSVYENLVQDFRFDPYMAHLLTGDLSLPSTTIPSRIVPAVGDLMGLPPYSIDDLLTPNSSLTNVTSLPNGDTARSLLAGHDGLASNINNTTHTLSPPSTVTNTLPTIDPLHGLLLGNTTAFDSVTQQQQEHRTRISPSQQQQQTAAAATTSPSTLMNDLFKSKVTTDQNASSRLINGTSPSPFDLADKEVAESMSCTTNYPLQFEALPDDADDNEDVDTVFMPIKTNDDDEPVNGLSTQDPLLSPPKYGDTSLWSKSCHSGGESPMKRMNASSRQGMDDFSDPTETSDKDDDSTADEEELPHTRIKRRGGRSPSGGLVSSQLPLNVDTLHAIRELTHQLNEFRSHSNTLVTTSQTIPQTIISQSDQNEKIERCCQRLDQLTSKFDRFINLDQPAVIARPSRPSPGAAPIEILSTASEPQVTLSDAHYDRLEAMLIDKIQTYVQGAMKSVFEPYRDLKDNLHKDLAAKLLATDTVIKQSMTQIFRSKTMIDSLSNAVANAIQATMITSYRDTFNQIVIPSFEKAAINMFQQTNDVFKRGTKEYLQEMIEYGRQQQRSLIQQREQMMAEIRKECTQLTKEFEKKNQELSLALKTEIVQYMTGNLDPFIRETTRAVIRDETTAILRELFIAQKKEIDAVLGQHLRQYQQPPVAVATTPKVRSNDGSISRTATPLPVAAASTPTSGANASPSEVKQQHVLKLARYGQLNSAFEYVLSAADLNLVLFLCENVRSSELFSLQPCPLQIPVLLSLIQQLAADLTSHQELKFNYLYEALICLDLSHPSVANYLQTVLIDLNKKLYGFIQNNASSPMTKRFQLLLMASQGLIQKIVQQRATPMTQLSSSSK